MPASFVGRRHGFERIRRRGYRRLERRVAEGCGYPYFVLPKVGGPASTMMACPPGEEKTEAFVQVRGRGFIQPYNSKLSIVTYVPEGFSVRYRIWAAGDDIGDAETR
jgi:ecotin